MSRWWAGVLGVLIVAASGALAPARAGGQEPPREARPTVVRAGVDVFFTGALFGPTDGSGGASVARELGAGIAAEATVGWGFGNGEDRDTGLQLGAVARYTLALGASRLHGVTAGIGPSVALLGDYGTVPFAHVEIGYSLRLRAGFDLLVAAGPQVVLADSKDPPAHNCGIFGESQCDRFHAGDTGPVIRLGVGWAF